MTQLEEGIQHLRDAILGDGGAEDIFAEYKDREDKPLKQFGIFGKPVEVSDKQHGEFVNCVGLGKQSIVHEIQKARDSFHDMLDSDTNYDKCINAVRQYAKTMTMIVGLKDKPACKPFRVVSPDFIRRADKSYKDLFKLLVEWTGIKRSATEKGEVDRVINEIIAASMAPYVGATVGMANHRRGGGKTRRVKRVRRRASHKRASSHS